MRKCDLQGLFLPAPLKSHVLRKLIKTPGGQKKHAENKFRKLISQLILIVPSHIESAEDPKNVNLELTIQNGCPALEM